MATAVFDPFSGASGDMILGALVSVGAPLAAVQSQLDLLRLPITLAEETVDAFGMSGSRVLVNAEDDAHSRTWHDIRGLIERSGLADTIKESALAIFARLAEAEAAAHRVPVDDVHFHEVGGLDAIADICGAAIALDLLGVDRLMCGPLAVGSGFVRTSHGVLPVPAPATAHLIALANAPIRTASPIQIDTPAELLTPTGAAILTTLASFDLVDYRPSRLGHGFGSRSMPWPNALRVWLCETGEAPGGWEAYPDGELQMETNLDDMNPQDVEILSERLFAAGALDVWVTPIQMKKSRPAFTVSALLPISKQDELTRVLIEQSSTLGVRAWPVERTKAIRRFESLTTRWGDVSVKLRGWHGRVIDAAPEYDDCARIARDHDIPVRTVRNEAHRLAEAFIGRRISVDGELG